MTTSSQRRSVTVERASQGRFAVTNSRGGRIAFGTGGDTDFTPTELLLAAIAGCTAIDVDIITSRRAGGLRAIQGLPATASRINGRWV